MTGQSALDHLAASGELAPRTEAEAQATIRAVDNARREHEDMAALRKVPRWVRNLADRAYTRGRRDVLDGLDKALGIAETVNAATVRSSAGQAPTTLAFDLQDPRRPWVGATPGMIAAAALVRAAQDWDSHVPAILRPRDGFAIQVEEASAADRLERVDYVLARIESLTDLSRLPALLSELRQVVSGDAPDPRNGDAPRGGSGPQTTDPEGSTCR